MQHTLLGTPRQEDCTLWSEQAVCLFLCTSKIGQQPDYVIRCPHGQLDQPRPVGPTTASWTNPGIGAESKLTQEEREHRRLKGLCYYCSLTIDLPAPDCRNSRHPKPPVAGRATFTITGEPEATIEEEVEGPPTESEN